MKTAINMRNEILMNDKRVIILNEVISKLIV